MRVPAKEGAKRRSGSGRSGLKDVGTGADVNRGLSHLFLPHRTNTRLVGSNL